MLPTFYSKEKSCSLCSCTQLDIEKRRSYHKLLIRTAKSLAIEQCQSVDGFLSPTNWLSKPSGNFAFKKMALVYGYIFSTLYCSSPQFIDCTITFLKLMASRPSLQKRVRAVIFLLVLSPEDLW